VNRFGDPISIEINSNHPLQSSNSYQSSINSNSSSANSKQGVLSLLLNSYHSSDFPADEYSFNDAFG
jgi:hypothetical protein